MCTEPEQTKREDAMTVKVRRVVTGHDGQGKAVVLFDSATGNVVSARAGQSATVLWQTSEFPTNNDGAADVSTAPVKTVNPKGTVFRVVEFEPGVEPRIHRTDSVDYAVILSGEIEMELDDTKVRLKTGDCLVQRGTVHNWVNHGPAPCVIAFVLVAAEPATANGKPLQAVG
jgi:quercetin dioxygenase-like cupin family protein